MKKTFFAIMSFLFVLSVNAQEWVGIGKSSSTKIQETLISSSEKKVVVDVKVSGFYKESVRTPQGEQLIISGKGMAYMPIQGAPNLPMWDETVQRSVCLTVTVMSSSSPGFREHALKTGSKLLILLKQSQQKI